MLKDWIAEKQKKAKQELAKLQKQIEEKAKKERFLNKIYTDEEYAQRIEEKKADMMLRVPIFVPLNFNMKLLENIPKEADESLEEWIKSREDISHAVLDVYVVSSILMAYQDIFSYSYFIKNKTTLQNFNKKMQTCAKKQAIEQYKQRKPITPYWHSLSPSMRIIALEEYLEATMLIPLETYDYKEIRTFVLGKYSKDTFSTKRDAHKFQKNRPYVKKQLEQVKQLQELLITAFRENRNYFYIDDLVKIFPEIATL